MEDELLPWHHPRCICKTPHSGPNCPCIADVLGGGECTCPVPAPESIIGDRRCFAPCVEQQRGEQCPCLQRIAREVERSAEGKPYTCHVCHKRFKLKERYAGLFTPLHAHMTEGGMCPGSAMEVFLDSKSFLDSLEPTEVEPYKIRAFSPITPEDLERADGPPIPPLERHMSLEAWEDPIIRDEKLLKGWLPPVFNPRAEVECAPKPIPADVARAARRLEANLEKAKAGGYYNHGWYGDMDRLDIERIISHVLAAPRSST